MTFSQRKALVRSYLGKEVTVGIDRPIGYVHHQGEKTLIYPINYGFIPDVLDTNIYNEIIKVSSEDAFSIVKLLGKKEGMLVGISSGAAAFAAIEIAKKEENFGKNIVVLLPDTGDRYLSTEVFKD